MDGVDGAGVEGAGVDGAGVEGAGVVGAASPQLITTREQTRRIARTRDNFFILTSFLPSIQYSNKEMRKLKSLYIVSNFMM